MRFLRLKEVMHITGLGRTSVYNFMAEGKFPKSVSLGDRAVAWIEADVEEWMEQKVADRDNNL